MIATPAATALAVIEMARQGRFTDISERFAPQLRPMVPPEALRAAWDSELAKHGPLTSVGTPLTEPAGPGTVIVKVPLTFERGALTAAVGLASGQSWVHGLRLMHTSAVERGAPWHLPAHAGHAAV